MDVYNLTTYPPQQPVTIYEPYGQSYTTFVRDLQGVPVPYSSSYPPPSYPIDAGAGTVPPHWYPPNLQQQQQQAAPYYYFQPANYTQQPQPIPMGPMGQPYHGTPDHSRRHSVPLRTPSMIRGPENEAIDNTGVNYPLPLPRSFVSKLYLYRGWSKHLTREEIPQTGLIIQRISATHLLHSHRHLRFHVDHQGSQSNLGMRYGWAIYLQQQTLQPSKTTSPAKPEMKLKVYFLSQRAIAHLSTTAPRLLAMKL